jgi:hypothetical protein
VSWKHWAGPVLAGAWRQELPIGERKAQTSNARVRQGLDSRTGETLARYLSEGSRVDLLDDALCCVCQARVSFRILAPLLRSTWASAEGTPRAAAATAGQPLAGCGLAADTYVLSLYWALLKSRFGLLRVNRLLLHTSAHTT